MTRAPRGALRPSPVPRSRRAWALPLVAAGLLAAGIPTAAQPSTDPADLPVCADVTGPTSECRLPRWPSEGAATLPSLFGEIDRERGSWIADAAADVAPGGLDILGVGVTRVRVEDAAGVRESPELLRKGGKKKAVTDGDAVLVRVVLDRALEAIDSGHAGVFVVTDTDGVRSNNAPLGVVAPDGPFADHQHAYSIHAVAEQEGLTLLHTDLSKKRWYRGNTAFAASQPAPGVIDVLVPLQSFGDSVRVVSYAEADGAGTYDVAGLGPVAAPAPLDGRVGTLPRCVDASISNQTFTVRRLVENGQTFRGIETPRSWLGGAMFTLRDEERLALETLMAAAGTPTSAALEVLSSVVIIDEGLNVRQTVPLAMHLLGDTAYLGFQLGLARRGYHVLRDIEPESTGDATVDAFLGRVTDALVAAMPPIRSTNREGALLGGGAGACLPATPGETA